MLIFILIELTLGCSDADKVICVSAFAACGNICVCDLAECACCPLCAVCLMAASATCCECLFPDWKECSEQANPCTRKSTNLTAPNPYMQCCGGMPYDIRDRSCCGYSVTGQIYDSKSSKSCCKTGSYPYIYRLCDYCCQESISSIEIVCCSHPCVDPTKRSMKSFWPIYCNKKL